MSIYPTGFVTYPDVVDEIDVVAADRHNSIADEVIALQTFVGSNPHGLKASLTERLSPVLSTSGGFFVTNADYDGADTYPGLYWYRSDTDTLRVTKGDGSVQSIGGSLSNVIFSWSGIYTLTNNTEHGVAFLSHPLQAFPGWDTEFSGTGGWSPMYGAFSDESTWKGILHFKLVMFTGLSSVDCYSLLGYETTEAGQNANCRVAIGALTSPVMTRTGGPTWVDPVSINLSSLDIGTAYDCTIDLRSDGSRTTTLWAVTIIGQ